MDWPLQFATALAALGTLAALWTRRFPLARFWAAGQVTLILWGWALAQYPYLVRPDLTIHNGAAPPAVMRALLWALAAGVVLLFPSYGYLFHVFQGPHAKVARPARMKLVSSRATVEGCNQGTKWPVLLANL